MIPVADWKKIDGGLARLGRSFRGAFFPYRSGGPKLFIDPVEEVRVSKIDQLASGLQRVEELRTSHTLAGWIAYELGAELRPGPFSHSHFPVLLRFGAYARDAEVNATASPPDFGSYLLDGFRWTETQESHRHKILLIQEQIQSGNVYQVNFTNRLGFRFEGDPRGLFRDLCRAQPVTGAALFREPDRWILSLSPELFFRMQEDLIEVQPMKGTLSRGRTIEEDWERMAQLACDPKNRAENLMIVDLMRNDLGKLAKTGTVEVTRLFEVHRLPTVLQMTSTIRAHLKSPRTTLKEILEAVFPCGSITGAPKLAAMELIRRLESTPRGVYCGALGTVSATDMNFQVGIRTLTLKPVDGAMAKEDPYGTYEGELGVGSGIVADSDAEAEWEECIWKAKFFVKRPPEFQLIETLSWDGSWRRLPRHVRRLMKSAAFFDFPFDEEKVRIFLQKLVRDRKSLLPDCGALREPRDEREETGAGLYKVRVLLDRDGGLQGSIEPVLPMQQPVTIALARERVDSRNTWLYHKTTNRALYSAAQAACRKHHIFDLIFRNERGELTEGSISNLFLRIDDEWLAPPLESGLLPGVMRDCLLETLPARESVLYLEDLRQANQIVVSNSVQGAMECKLADQEVSVFAPVS